MVVARGARGERGANGVSRTYKRSNTRPELEISPSNVPPIRVSARDSKQKPPSVYTSRREETLSRCLSLPGRVGRRDKNGRALGDILSEKDFRLFRVVSSRRVFALVRVT